jgi:hypothetical protein
MNPPPSFSSTWQTAYPPPSSVCRTFVRLHLRMEPFFWPRPKRLLLGSAPVPSFSHGRSSRSAFVPRRGVGDTRPKSSRPPPPPGPLSMVARFGRRPEGPAHPLGRGLSISLHDLLPSPHPSRAAAGGDRRSLWCSAHQLRDECPSPSMGEGARRADEGGAAFTMPFTPTPSFPRKRESPFPFPFYDRAAPLLRQTHQTLC